MLKVNTIVSSINIDHLSSIGNFLAKLNKREKLTWSLIQITNNYLDTKYKREIKNIEFGNNLVFNIFDINLSKLKKLKILWNF